MFGGERAGKMRGERGICKMVICPIARAVHCTGCLFVKFCPAKTTLGDYGKDEGEFVDKAIDEESQKSEEKSKNSTKNPRSD
jgi:hypothetical protein